MEHFGDKTYSPYHPDPLITFVVYQLSYCLVAQSCLNLVTPRSVALQAPLSMGFLQQEYSNGLRFSPPEDLPNSEIEPVSPALAGRFFTPEPLF